MQARRAARELALILLSQSDKNIKKLSEKDIDDTIIQSVRILADNAKNELKITVGSLVEMKDFLETYEADHEINLKRPIDAVNKPVPIPLTSDMTGKVNDMLEVAEKALAALEIAEITTLENKEEIKKYTVLIAKMFKENSEFTDSQIQKFAKGWDIERLVKMDKDILRIAITELLFIKDTPMKVVVDEAVELAKKYSTEESSSFINGILAKVIVENGVS